MFDAALDENVDTGIQEVDQAVSEFIFTTKLTLAGLGASTATATAVVADTLSVLSEGNSVSFELNWLMMELWIIQLHH